MKFLNYIVLSLALLFSTQSYALKQQYHSRVLPIVSAFKTLDKAKIASLVHYPLARSYPVPAIKNEAELVEHFDQLFDQSLITQITSSNIEADWAKVGWRGIMLNHGVMWVNTEGKIISINHQTDKEQELAKRLMAEDKQSLHPSISSYKEPVLDWQTAKYRIRVDDLGDSNYRYAAWPINKKPSDKPDIIITNGDITYEGSGGNHHYTFKNGRYRYVLQVTVIGCDTSPPGWLEVYKDDERLLSEDVISIK